MNASKVKKMFNAGLVESALRKGNNAGMTENPIGKIILAQLKRMKKTQGWLAEQTGVSNPAVHKWIQTGQIGRDNAVTAALALKLSVDELLGQANSAPSPSDFSLEWLSADERNLLTNYRSANDMGRGMIDSIARGAPKDAALERPQKNHTK